MRHQKHGRKFGRQSGPRHALMSNLVTALIEHERIRTTDAKAKELRRLAERTITWATSVGGLVGSDKADSADKARVVHAMRMAQRVVKHKPTLQKLFEEVGPRFVGRAGGYTRIMKVGQRHGDAAPISIIELIDYGQHAPAAEPDEKPGKAAKADKPKAEKVAKPKAEKPKAKAKAEAAPAKKPAAKKAEPKAEKAEKPKAKKKKSDD
jgi:large subunit ribosomal protein L17